LSTAFRLDVPQNILDFMVAQAVAELPNECCGFLAGRLLTDETVGRVETIFPLVNAAASPVEFDADPHSLFAALSHFRKHDLRILAIYHSHPTSEPIPSQKDRERNYSEEVMNLIISLAREETLIRAWWLTATDHWEANWKILE
jgi:proteasome lid subunit RPN8/RPN11